MILASHQPNFFPYMGYFYKIARSDLFIFSDDVKFSNKKTGDMHNYNYIKGPHGKQKITLPVRYKTGALMKEVDIFCDEKQIKKILTAIEQYYSKSPFFEEVFPVIKTVFNLGYDQLIALNMLVIEMLCRKFGISTKMHRAIRFEAKKNHRLIEMCQTFGADTYLCGTGAAAYIDSSEFERAGIKLVYSDYSPPVYPQRYGDFIPNLSVLDWIFNMGYTLPEGWLSWKK